jgi:hypothetical protein
VKIALGEALEVHPRLLTRVLEIAAVWTVLSVLLVGSWVFALEIWRRLGRAPARMPPGRKNLTPGPVEYGAKASFPLRPRVGGLLGNPRQRSDAADGTEICRHARSYKGCSKPAIRSRRTA